MWNHKQDSGTPEISSINLKIDLNSWYIQRWCYEERLTRKRCWYFLIIPLWILSLGDINYLSNIVSTLLGLNVVQSQSTVHLKSKYSLVWKAISKCIECGMSIRKDNFFLGVLSQTSDIIFLQHSWPHKRSKLYPWLLLGWLTSPNYSYLIFSQDFSGKPE